MSEGTTGGGDAGADSGPPRSSRPVEVLIGWLEELSRWGYDRARTNAVGPALAAWFTAAGFTMTQQLALLRAQVPTLTSPDLTPELPRGTVRSCSGRVGALSTHRPYGMASALLEVDRDSFPDHWVLDERSLVDALRATPVSRIFHAAAPVDSTSGSQRAHRMDGFLIVGVAGRTSYIQRLAVHPDRRRAGLARALMTSGLEWSRRKGCSRSVVNTEIDNAAALSLYEGLGYTRMTQELAVMEASW